MTGFLILDDSVCTKPKGRKMNDLGQHYSGTEKRVVRGHGLFTGLYVLLGRRCPLESRLYRQRAVCEREGVPFRSKVDLAVETIERFQPIPGTHIHLLVDAWYHCNTSWQAGPAFQPGETDLQDLPAVVSLPCQARKPYMRIGVGTHRPTRGATWFPATMISSLVAPPATPISKLSDPGGRA